MRALTVILLACLLVSLFCVIYPMYVIRPFRAQGARELALALEVIRFRPWVTVIAAVVALATLLRRRGIVQAVIAGLVCVFAVLARVNVYELMFHPAGAPSFEAI